MKLNTHIPNCHVPISTTLMPKNYNSLIVYFLWKTFQLRVIYIVRMNCHIWGLTTHLFSIFHFKASHKILPYMILRNQLSQISLNLSPIWLFPILLLNCFISVYKCVYTWARFSLWNLGWHSPWYIDQDGLNSQKSTASVFWG